MYYAHKGNATDNGFPVVDDCYLIRQFLAYPTMKERQQAQNAIWQESNQELNLIFCKPEMVVQYLGTHFYVAPDGLCYDSYDSYCWWVEERDLQADCTSDSN